VARPLSFTSDHHAKPNIALADATGEDKPMSVSVEDTPEDETFIERDRPTAGEEGGDIHREPDVDDPDHSLTDESPLTRIIEGERHRLDLIDAVIAGVAADLDPDQDSLRLRFERLKPGAHHSVLCMVRRMLRKSHRNLDSIYVDRAFRDALNAALARREHESASQTEAH
jgi:hypothetical protein